MDALPAIDEAIAIAAWNLDRPLVAEVQQHLNSTTVRAVALENAAGLKRGASAGPLGAKIRVLVGSASLSVLEICSQAGPYINGA